MELRAKRALAGPTFGPGDLLSIYMLLVRSVLSRT